MPTTETHHRDHRPGKSSPRPAPAAPQGQQDRRPAANGYVDRWWHARVWLGFSLGSWLRLLWRHRFAVSPHRIAAAVLITFVSLGHSFFKLLQWALLGRRIARTEVEQAPVFIVGHWRSGTTLLHELLSRDERHAYPTNYQCFAPHHFLLTEWIATRLFGFLLPAQRPMDNMAVGWSRPQEDEFALCALGQPSPYWRLAFPTKSILGDRQGQAYLDLREVPPAAVQRWKQTLLWLVKVLTYKYRGRRLILKSPPHTARVDVLLQLFPDARFIHIVRDPYVLYQSTVNLWKKLTQAQHLRTPRFDGLEEYVFATFSVMYDAWEQARDQIPDNRLYEVKYEDLIADPLGTLRRIYAHTELGDIQPALPNLRRYLDETRDYQANRYEIAAELKAAIRQRWSPYFERYGYE